MATGSIDDSEQPVAEEALDRPAQSTTASIKLGANQNSAPELPPEVAKEFGLHHGSDSEVTVDEEQLFRESVDINDTETEADVADIVSKESDALLAVQDNTPKVLPAIKTERSLKHFLRAWWRNKRARTITLLLCSLSIVLAASMPESRYFMLNSAGVRSAASVTVLDATTQLPLKNVTVRLGAQQSLTNREGVAKLSKLKLGRYTLSIKRLAFAAYEQPVTIGWGSNPLGTHVLKATGLRYVVLVKDYVSGKPIAGAEAGSEEANALSDKGGKATLTLDSVDGADLPVVFSAPGYRNETVLLDVATSSVPEVMLVPAGRAVFVSKQSGKYDVYATDLDGKDKKLLLAGTGTEESNISLVVNTGGTHVALVSTRDNVRDQDGYLLRTLTIINVSTGASSAVDRAEQIQLVDWTGDRLIYRSTIAGASGANPQRNRILSYNPVSNSRTQLATANQFNAVLSAADRIYYAMSSTDPSATLGLFVVKPDGTARKRLSKDEVWTGLRTSYNVFNLQTPDAWFTYDLRNEQLISTVAPPRIVAYAFVDEPGGNGRSVWSDTQNGKGVLMLYDTAKGTSKVLHSQDGITNPLRWIGSKAIIYRIANGAEIADYVASPDGGSVRKIADVAATYGFAQPY